MASRHVLSSPIPSIAPPRRVDLVPLLVVALMAGVAVIGGAALGFAYDSRPITAVIVGATSLWAIGRTARGLRPGSAKAAFLAEAMALLIVLSLLASIDSAVLGAGPHALIDDRLAAADAALVPWISWTELIGRLLAHPTLMWILSYVYVSLNWQPTALLILAWVTGRDQPVRRFVAAWAVSIVMCILPFYWIPALGPYPYFGVHAGPANGLIVSLAFDTPGLLHGLRDGTIRTISEHTVNGLITMPSFHACSAMLFAWAFAGWRSLRWIMIPLNVLMTLAAVPVGGHYFVDIVAGCLVALVSITVVLFVDRPATNDARTQESRDAALIC
jgi:membrane-associated phospholipid phosphatase